MDPIMLEIPKEAVVPVVKIKRKYNKKAKEESKKEGLLRKFADALEPAKKKLKMGILDSEVDSEKIIKNLENVEKMDEKKCQRKLTLMEVEQLRKLSENMAAGFCNAVGTLFDMALRGNGHIKKEFNNDKALELALAKEVSVLTALLSNRAKILISTGNDIGVGFLNARLNDPIIEEIVEKPVNPLKQNVGEKEEQSGRVENNSHCSQERSG